MEKTGTVTRQARIDRSLGLAGICLSRLVALAACDEHDGSDRQAEATAVVTDDHPQPSYRASSSDLGSSLPQHP